MCVNAPLIVAAIVALDDSVSVFAREYIDAFMYVCIHKYICICMYGMSAIVA